MILFRIYLHANLNEKTEWNILINEESTDFLKEELKKIEAWENEQKDLWFWEKIGRLPFLLLDKITPKFIQEKIGLAIDELGSYIQTGGKYLVNEETILKKFVPDDLEWTPDEIRDALREQIPLSKMDEVANDNRKIANKIGRYSRRHNRDWRDFHAGSRYPSSIRIIS